jgi:hypothetical protein
MACVNKIKNQNKKPTSVTFAQELERGNFLQKSSFENLGSKSRLHQAALVLIKVYRQVQSYEKEIRKFVEILRHYNSIAAETITYLSQL